MAAFKMCGACQAEYENPASRRFHAQPNACWDCGPQVQLLAADGTRLDVAEPIREAAALLQQGSVVAIKGLGGFHLACDAQNELAVDEIARAEAACGEAVRDHGAAGGGCRTILRCG